MKPVHIDDFYHVAAEALHTLYGVFPVRHLLLVEDISGPIRYDLTGMPDRKSTACFEGLVWLADHGLINYRTVEPRDIGVEGAVLTQRAFVLLNGAIRWEDGETMSRIEGIREARRLRAYDDLGTIVQDLLAANCQWGAPVVMQPLRRGPRLSVVDEDFG
ncbi:MAG: hypothetical protein V2I45_05335 [Halieaceae bacterium]|jgi:hypothetical protein|nr:hypothetical protein [Halieaceae bacterium]